MTGPIDDIEVILRRALDGTAERIGVAPDALGEIRTRINARRRRWLLGSGRPVRSPHSRGGLMLTLGSAAAVSAVVLAVGLGSCGPQATTAHPPAGSSTSPAPTTGGGHGPTPSPQPTKAPTVNVPVYYIGATKAGPRLFREYHLVPAGDTGDGPVAGRVLAALVAMLDGRNAFDPDYTSQWPASATVSSVTISGGVATVDLSGATVNAYGPAGNAAALQQLIWTATAFPGGTGVRLLFDGAPRATLWASNLPVAGVLHRAPRVDTLAPVWVIDPQQGATVSGPVTVHLAGIVFEGTIQLRVRDSAGATVTRRTVRLSAGAPAQGTATVTLDLPPGAYTIEAYEVSMKDGSVVASDDHAFTVR